MRLHRFYRASLLFAAVLAPRSRRRDWLAEWTSELWYVVQEASSDPAVYIPSSPGSVGAGLVCWVRSQQIIAPFCMGSFRDALSLRRETVDKPGELVTATVPVPAAARCALVLTLLAVATCGLALLLPGTRRALAVSSPLDRDLFLIAPGGQAERGVPLIRLSSFRVWHARRQHLFVDLAFYQPALKSVHVAPHIIPELLLARSTPNLFELLGEHIDLAPGSLPAGQPQLILSKHVWRTRFHADPQVFGRVIKVGLRPVVLAGVLPEEAWRLPGQIDGWLLEPDLNADALSPSTRGFVLARLLPNEEHASFGKQWPFFIPEPDGSSSLYECISPSLLAPQPLRIFLFTALLALLSLPATTSLSLGEYSTYRHRLTTRARLHRWLFLAVKLALIFPAVYFASLDLAYVLPGLTPVDNQYIQIVTSFFLGLFALRWVVHDQRRRCPVCLSTLSSPARVGQASRNFLDWNGTELICAGGHGLLHVPELPTSWFHTQRWLYLDPSWSCLFPPGT